MGFSFRKYNLVGNTFTHLTGGNKGYSVHGKVAWHIVWVQDGTGVGTFFIDHAIEQAEEAPANYGWLLESRSICDMTDRIKANPDRYLPRFDAIFTHDKELLAMSDKFKFVPAQGSWIQSPRIRHKTKLVSMIASNKTLTSGHHTRLTWVDRLRNSVDLYGRGFNEIELKEDGLDEYMFSVCIENGQYETYFTEKILDCFLTGTVPIYLGAPDIGDHFNMDGIILLEDTFSVADLNEERYKKMLPAVLDNFNKALEMEVLEDYIYERYLTES